MLNDAQFAGPGIAGKAEQDIFLDEVQRQPAVIDKDDKIGIAAECLQPESAGAGKEIENLGVLHGIAENTEQGLARSVGRGPYALFMKRRREKFSAFLNSTDDSQKMSKNSEKEKVVYPEPDPMPRPALYCVLPLFSRLAGRRSDFFNKSKKRPRGNIEQKDNKHHDLWFCGYKHKDQDRGDKELKGFGPGQSGRFFKAVKRMSGDHQISKYVDQKQQRHMSVGAVQAKVAGKEDNCRNHTCGGRTGQADKMMCRR